MTHKELVERAAKWLKNTRKCPLVVTEIAVSYGTNEIPDALGWRYARHTTLVECKASRADFQRDKKKVFRQFWDMGCGQQRFFMTPPDLVTVDELPEGWGLLYCHPHKIQIVKECKMPVLNKDVTWNESVILYSLVRRAEIRGFDVQSPYSEAPKVKRRRRRRTNKLRARK